MHLIKSGSSYERPRVLFSRHFGWFRRLGDHRLIAFVKPDGSAGTTARNFAQRRPGMPDANALGEY